ncbi:MAG: hypothetical protein PHE09_01225 [Oscillospiraceae bacterium]|nr:hypothetical protein [Oscillospiraceae bacterium]
MNNIVFERDYEEEHRKQAEADASSTERAIFNIATDGGFLKAYSDAMDAIPKVVVPADKENYEYLLARADEFARRWGGKVRGVVNYQKWDATIDLILPFAEFGDADDRSLLMDFAEKSHSITFEATENGKLKIHIFIYYFEEIADKDEYFTAAVEQNPELYSLLMKYAEEHADDPVAEDAVDTFDDDEQVELITWFFELCVASTGESKDAVFAEIFSRMRSDYKGLLHKIKALREKMNGEYE